MNNKSSAVKIKLKDKTNVKKSRSCYVLVSIIAIICLIAIPWSLYGRYSSTLNDVYQTTTSGSNIVILDMNKNKTFSIFEPLNGYISSLYSMAMSNSTQNDITPLSEATNTYSKNQESNNNVNVVVPDVITSKQQNIMLPVLGPRPVNGTKPMLGIHSGRDAIFALACNYPLDLYQFFVGSLRKFGYTDDIVLAVSPKNQMGGGVYDYIKQTNVVAYGFEVDCKGKDQCKLKDEFLG
jgi:hypothetical protein